MPEARARTVRRGMLALATAAHSVASAIFRLRRHEPRTVGSSMAGSFVWTLVLTDMASG